MKVLLIGATGTIGKAVERALSDQHELITVGFRDGMHQVDLGNPASIQRLFETVGKVDAIISTAGLAKFGPMAQLSDADFDLALQNKLMGQVNLVRIGQSYVNEGGSITLTSGILSRHPMPGSSSIAMANGALESFVRAAALELPQLRLNVVAPAFVKETMAMMGMDSTHGISAADTSKTYLAALSGSHHGETLDVTDHL
ncbi:short chain dehydrogenase [Ferrimonas balearica]|uniref:short chain dehydrogenase n=1 Tax=Ferrimonas balearica TaxID=44012 RepID=UPI001C991ADA|nr:short chain dehydrogenase [Ferrimonas balearica]MBY5921759.1 short chain dehydrogenase [Ferrimonas balearica]MBY5994901.1 short chain dehydrogenase [Ferrimonas balearica]